MFIMICSSTDYRMISRNIKPQAGAVFNSTANITNWQYTVVMSELLLLGLKKKLPSMAAA